MWRLWRARGKRVWVNGYSVRESAGVSCDTSAFTLKPGDVIEFDDGRAVGSVGKFEIKDFGVVLGLLQTGGGRFVFGLRLDDRDGKVARVAEDVIGAFA